ncbi:Fc receptor-like protein 2 isoform X2 [Tachysurus ichikawai]
MQEVLCHVISDITDLGDPHVCGLRDKLTEKSISSQGRADMPQPQARADSETEIACDRASTRALSPDSGSSAEDSTPETSDLDLQIAPAEVTEGQSVVLTCKTTCNLTDPTFIWYKNSSNLTTKTNENNEVRLQSVSSEDAGSYSCAVRGYEHLHSPVQTLRVRYPPKNVSVSVIPSGDSVTLTGSSDANPPVQSYTWFKVKESSPVGSGQSYRAVQSGQYYCTALRDQLQCLALLIVRVMIFHCCVITALFYIMLCG